MALTRSLRVASAPLKYPFTRWGSTNTVYTSSVLGLAPNVYTALDDASTTQIVSLGGASLMPGLGVNSQFGASLRFMITDVSNSTEFSTLFDHYHIDQVDIEISYLKNMAAEGATPSVQSTASMPTIMYCPDFDDNNVPANAAEMNQRSRTKQWTFRGDGQPLKFSIQPRQASLMFREGGTTIAYGVGGAVQPVDFSYTDIPFYGCKLWFQDVYATANANGQTADSAFRIKAKYHLSMYGTR